VAASFAPEDLIENVERAVEPYVIELSGDVRKAKDLLASLALAGRQLIEAEAGKFVVELNEWEAKLLEALHIGKITKA